MFTYHVFTGGGIFTATARNAVFLVVRHRICPRYNVLPLAYVVHWRTVILTCLDSKIYPRWFDHGDYPFSATSTRTATVNRDEWNDI